MANLACHLTKRVQTKHGWRYCPVVMTANGKVKPNAVLIDGKHEQHSEGSYYIEWWVGTKRIRKSVGKNATDAYAKKLQKEAALNAAHKGVAVVEQSEPTTVLTDAIQLYLSNIKITRTPATHSAYQLTLQNFTDSCSKKFVEQIDRTDLINFQRHLLAEGVSERTVYNRFGHACAVPFPNVQRHTTQAQDSASRFIQTDRRAGRLELEGFLVAQV